MSPEHPSSRSSASREGRCLPGAGKTPNRPRAGLGFRVWKLRVSMVNREELKALCNDVINYLLGVARASL